MEKEMLKLRNKVEKIDKKIIGLLKKRFEICKKIGNIKKENNMNVEDLELEEKLINQRADISSVDKDFTKKLFELIFNEAKRLQK